MKTRNKVKLITTIICMVLSLIALTGSFLRFYLMYADRLF